VDNGRQNVRVTSHLSYSSSAQNFRVSLALLEIYQSKIQNPRGDHLRKTFRPETTKMPGDETLTKRAGDDSESESEDDEDIVDEVPTVEVDPTTLTPLTPEVISKQVRLPDSLQIAGDSLFYVRPLSIWVRMDLSKRSISAYLTFRAKVPLDMSPTENRRL